MKLRAPPALQIDLIAAQFLENVIKRLNVAAVADLNQTITNPPTQAEVQAISDKVDELLAAMRSAGILDS